MHLLNMFTLGAFDETGLLVGIVRFVRESGIKTRHKANIYGMYVSSANRGKGIGKALLMAVMIYPGNDASVR